MRHWAFAGIVAITGLLMGAQTFSWYYNENGGFGFYQPEGWKVSENGRSARMTGPVTDRVQSEIFVGSDWVTEVKTLEDLKVHLTREGWRGLRSAQVRDLHGFQRGSVRHGSLAVLRAPENIIVVEFDLRGSAEQVDEGQTALSSLEIRTRGNDSASGHEGGSQW